MRDAIGEQLDALSHVEPAALFPPFQWLGHDRGRYYFVTDRGGQVLSFKGSELDHISTLLQLAREEFWQTHFGDGKGKIDARKAAARLIDKGYTVGVYDPGRLRGRGAWLDEGRVVMHLGDRLLVDGVEMRPQAITSRWLYEQSRALPVALAKPLSTAEASRLVELCQLCGWEDADGMGRILAGWIVCAQVCGAMPWRPHVWVSGEAGSGKTWVVKNVIRPAIGSIAIVVEGKTTEPGIRGELGADSRPVLFDEPETQNRADRERVQQVIDLARHASSEEGAVVLKGQAGGGGVARSHIRSAFAFSSINVGMTQAADESRTLILTMRPPADPASRADAFSRLEATAAEVLTPDFAGRLLARTLGLVPAIRANAKVFAEAIARRTGSRRMGDTVGVLLAGAWSLGSEREITLETATEVVERQRWIGQVVDRQEVGPEWDAALHFLLQQRVRAVGRIAPLSGEVTVGELIEAAAGRGREQSTERRDASAILPSDAREALGRIGIRVEDACSKVCLSVRGDAIGRYFDSSPWGGSWKPTLMRAPGASRHHKKMRFGASPPTDSVALPLGIVMGLPD